MEGGLLDCGRIIAQERMSVDDDTTIADIYTWSEKIVPLSFVKAATTLKNDISYTLKYADPDDDIAFRCYPRLPVDGFIDWNLSADIMHRLIRAAGPPFEGAYTYHVFNDRLMKLHILKSRIVEKHTNDLAVPGHVLKNDKNTGESWIKCMEGIIALQKCRYANEIVEFNPGKRWKSIRMRLGVKAEDLIIKFGEMLSND